MDLDIAEISALKSALVPAQVNVKLQVGASEQLKAVTEQIFEGIAQTPEPGKGAKLNTVA